MAAFGAATGKPVALAAWQESVAEPLRAQGISTFPNEGEALGVLVLADIAVALGTVISGARGTIASIDLNPVMVGAAGDGAVVVDALVECAATPTSGS